MAAQAPPRRSGKRDRNLIECHTCDPHRQRYDHVGDEDVVASPRPPRRKRDRRRGSPRGEDDQLSEHQHRPRIQYKSCSEVTVHHCSKRTGCPTTRAPSAGGQPEWAQNWAFLTRQRKYRRGSTTAGHGDRRAKSTNGVQLRAFEEKLLSRHGFAAFSLQPQRGRHGPERARPQRLPQ